MPIVLNGERRDVPRGCSVLELLEFLQLEPSRVAVEVDREIVKAARWAETLLKPDAKVEIVHFVGGG
jgi:thiamine biosynthesis protein ThiS